MKGEVISKCKEEKNLRIIVDGMLKCQQHFNESTKKANQRIGMIKRSFTYTDKEMFLNLYKSIDRPHLDYGLSYILYIRTESRKDI